ncbi:MAG: serine/threonine protein kinase [Deltaproteobacteria bacterium]|nr:serine/threonine protein kinase [Deltaproteobacteria bacterium]
MEGAARHSLIGATIGNYRVVSKLGEGGMGAVYLAEHPLIGKKVALKVLHEEYAANQDVVTRFFTEAKAVNDIGHPNIVDIVDYGMVQGGPGTPGFVYFIMEHLSGQSLSSLIANESPIPIDRAMHVATQIADALAASHAKGVIHRDLKPDNVYLIPRGRDKDFVKVLDFGIAKLTGDGGGSRKTRTGIVMGTPYYMSPEQCEGRGNIDNRADIYALGILAYEMLTGRVPFVGEGYGEILVQHLTKAAPPLSSINPNIPPHLEAVVMKALAKKREDRYADMDQFISALREPTSYVETNGGVSKFYAVAGGTLTGLSVPAPLSTNTPRPTTLTQGAGQIAEAPDEYIAPKSKTPLMAAAAAAVVVALGVGGYLMMGKGGEKPVAAVAPAPSPQAQAASAALQPVAAPVPTPSPAPPPEAPKTITLSVSSTPSGAAVLVGGEATPRGKTPLELTLPRGTGETELSFRLDGYKEKKKSVGLGRDAALDVALEKERRAPSDSHKRPDRPSSSEGKKPKTQASDDDVLAPSF